VISGVVFRGDPWSVPAPAVTSSGRIGYYGRVIWYAVLHVPCEPFRARDVQAILAVLGETVSQSRTSFFLKRLTECGYLRRERISRYRSVYRYWFTEKAREARRRVAGPPRCPVCGAVCVLWTRKVSEKRREALWLCPNLCEFKNHGEKARRLRRE